MVIQKQKYVEEIVNEFFSSSNVISFYSKCKLRKSEKKLFKKYLRERGNVLDLFCGAGRVAIPLAKIGFDVIGVDNNREMIKKARNMKREFNIKNLKFIYADASRIIFKA